MKNKATFYIHQAIKELSYDFAYAPAKSYLFNSLQLIEQVEKKREKREKLKLEEEKKNKEKKELLAKRVAEYAKILEVEKLEQ